MKVRGSTPRHIIHPSTPWRNLRCFAATDIHLVNNKQPSQNSKREQLGGGGLRYPVDHATSPLIWDFSQSSSSEDLPNKFTVRARLRSLLREASYLPDTYSRKWWQAYIVQRFKKYTKGEYQQEPLQNPKRGIKRTRDKLREAKDRFVQLQRANQGDRDELLKCLLTAYGRIGKKRRQLMSTMTKGELLSEGESLTNLLNDLVEKTLKPEARKQYLANVESRIVGLTREDLDKVKHDVEIDLRLKLLPAKLRSLAKSQMTINPPRSRGPRRLNPLIPAHNSWMKKMPENRVRNQIRKWYAVFLDRIQPPLPDSDWEDLMSKALGTFTDRNAIPIRRGQSQLSFTSTTPTALSMVTSYGKVPQRYFGNTGARVIDSRFMRRLYVEVLWQCPKIDWDKAEREWRVTWGYLAYNQAIGPQGADTIS